ncbi:MAG: MFS transporter [Bacteroidales bacterium]|nr:MFS transporter [Bacteroidales bacterium]
MNNKSITLRLILMNFLEFAVWGAYLTSLGRYLGNIGLGNQIKWFFAMQGIVSIFMPTLMGILADRKIQAQKVLSLCHLLAGIFMIAAGMYCQRASAGVAFGPLFVFYSLSVAFFMPTIALVNSVAYNALESVGKDPVKDFPPIRVFGTIGFIISMLCVNWIKIGGTAMQDSYTQLIASGVLSIVLCAYALTMPPVPVKKGESGQSLTEALGLKAFTLFKDRQFAIFFIFSMLLGSALQITNGYANTFLGSFASDPTLANTFAVKNSNALLSISQASETLCILLIPFFMKKFGIKNVMLIAMFAWVFRFGFFGLGSPDMPGVILFILSCIVYGVAFDFFNISGSLYVNENTTTDIRSSAQGLFMLMTNGLGASIGTLAAGWVVEKCGCFSDPAGWAKAWYIFAAYALVVGILFMILFKDPRKIAKAAPATDSAQA